MCVCTLQAYWNSVPPSPYGLDQLALAFSVAAEVKRATPRGLQGRGPVSHNTQEDSQAHHYHFLQALDSVIESLRRCSGSDVAPAVSVPCPLSAKFSLTCCSLPHQYQRQGWTDSRRGQSQLRLVLLVRGGRGGRLLSHASAMHRTLKTESKFEDER